VLEKKKLLKLSLTSVVAIVIGAFVGLVLNYQVIKDLRSEPVKVSLPVAEKEEEQEKVATFSGKIKPSVKPEIAAHYLEDDEGNIIVFLKSGKIESGFLGILEGQAVEVVGTVEEGSEGQKVLEVDEVHL